MNFKNSTLTLIAVLASLAIAMFIYWHDDEATAIGNKNFYFPNRAEVHKATLELLADNQNIERIETAFLTIGQGLDDASWSVRGTLNKKNRNIPLFAAIRYHCAKRRQNNQCWSLDELIIDGVRSPIVTITTGSLETTNLIAATPRSTNSRRTKQNQEKQVNTEVRVTAKANDNFKTGIAAPTREQKNTKAAGKTPPMVPAATTTWRARSNNVNARSAPSINSRIVFKMYTTTPLTLIEQRERWGLFEYPAANKERGRVWLHMNMVHKTNQ